MSMQRLVYNILINSDVLTFAGARILMFNRLRASGGFSLGSCVGSLWAR